MDDLAAKTGWLLEHKEKCTPGSVEIIVVDGDEYGAIVDDEGFAGFLTPGPRGAGFQLVHVEQANGQDGDQFEVEQSHPPERYGAHATVEGSSSYAPFLVLERKRLRVGKHIKEHDFDQEPGCHV
jgi:hypothetical protein